MPNPISAVSSREALWQDYPTDRADYRESLVKGLAEQTYGVCRNPTSVVGGVLCSNDTAISNACRRAKPDTFDDMLCDDPKLKEAQNTLLSLAWKAVELILGGKMGHSK